MFLPALVRSGERPRRRTIFDPPFDLPSMRNPFKVLMLHVLAAVSIAPSVAAQAVPALGPQNYELQNEDGTPIVPDEEWHVVAAPTLIRGVYFLGTFQKVEGETPVFVPGESGTAFKTASGYATVMASGSTTELVLESDGRWKETVIQGQNPGRQTWWD
jgi:hypothetical protein